MIDYGAPPAADEIEFSLFGPGYGEAVAVHLGDGTWLLVDSCLDPESKESASVTYLDRIGVAPRQVRTIVASHWHDDHVRGISRMSSRYADAEFVIPAVFNDREATAFLAAYSGVLTSGLSRGTRELYDVVKSRDRVFPALHRSIILDTRSGGRGVLVTALSPLPAAFAQFLARVTQYRAQRDRPVNHAPDLHPNTESVAIHFDFGDDALLLGGDLEESPELGWSAVVADSWSGHRRPATAYKVAHHGSRTGDCPGIWTTLLRSQPVACLTPYTLAGRRLPTEGDKMRIKANTPHAYISSGASRRPEMDARVLKRLGDMCRNMSKADPAFGAVRLRKPGGAAAWNLELFGAAQAL
jgi:hypothetical protein